MYLKLDFVMYILKSLFLYIIALYIELATPVHSLKEMNIMHVVLVSEVYPRL